MKAAVRPWYRVPLITLILVGLAFSLSQLPNCFAYFRRREIKSAYYRAAQSGMVPKPADVPDAVSVAAMCGVGGVPNLVLVKTSDTVNLLFSAKYDESSSDWRFTLRVCSTNYSKVQPSN